MFTAVLTFLKTKLFTNNGVFLLIFAGIVALFLISNSNTILSKLGFETTTNLKAQLVQSQADLKQLQAINAELNTSITELRVRHEQEKKAITQANVQREVIRTRVVEVIRDRQVQAAPNIRALEEKMVVTPETIVIPVLEYNRLSENNIDAINHVFNEFFPNTGG